MVVGEIPESTGVLVIGAGPGGYVAALRAAAAGKAVTLVERDAVGGTCLNVGCIPSKALIAAADRFHQADNGAAYGVLAEPQLDWMALQAYLRRSVAELTAGVNQLLSAARVNVLSGTARFVSPTRVAVEDAHGLRHLEFDDCILAAGSRPLELTAVAVDGARVVDSTGALFLQERPRSVTVIGGGYIGVELGTALAKLGVRVTIVERAGRILPELDAALASVVARRLAQLGVAVRTGRSADTVLDDGLQLDDGSVLEAERIVVAVGRVPNSDGLGLDHAGVRPRPDGRLDVGPDRRLARHLFAIGDLTDGPGLAHKATAEAEVAVAALCGEPAAFDPVVIPAVVFSDPEIATVGLTRQQAEDAGVASRSFRFPLAANARARLDGDAGGHCEMVVDDAGTVIGVHLVGPHVSELAGEAALAIEMAATVEELTAVIHPHPTVSESLPEAGWGAIGRALHVHRRRPGR